MRESFERRYETPRWTHSSPQRSRLTPRSLVYPIIWALALLAIILIAYLVVVRANEAHAQMPMPCSAMVEIDGTLRSQYHERVTAMGVSKNGTLVQIYTAEDTGTWTVVRLTPQGCARIIDAGDGWELAPAGEAS